MLCYTMYDTTTNIKPEFQNYSRIICTDFIDAL